jgi:hypothetical protein
VMTPILVLVILLSKKVTDPTSWPEEPPLEMLSPTEQLMILTPE